MKNKTTNQASKTIRDAKASSTCNPGTSAQTVDELNAKIVKLEKIQQEQQRAISTLIRTVALMQRAAKQHQQQYQSLQAQQDRQLHNILNDEPAFDPFAVLVPPSLAQLLQSSITPSSATQSSDVFEEPHATRPTSPTQFFEVSFPSPPPSEESRPLKVRRVSSEEELEQQVDSKDEVMKDGKE